MHLWGVLYTESMAESRQISDGLLAGLHDPAVRREAFDAVVGAWLRPLYWHVRRLVVVHEDAEDVVQETFIRAYDKVKDVAVIGLPDQRLGEIAAAIIELKDGVSCTEAEIQDFCRELPRYKRPRRVIFAKVPRNPTGKIEKPVLRQIYCGGRLVEEQTRA